MQDASHWAWWKISILNSAHKPQKKGKIIFTWKKRDSFLLREYCFSFSSRNSHSISILKGHFLIPLFWANSDWYQMTSEQKHEFKDEKSTLTIFIINDW